MTSSDAPDIFFNQELGNVYVSGQTGQYIKGKNQEINAKFRINNAGYNSPHNYSKQKDSNVYRIAVIGDSFIEALQVDNDKSYPYILESILNEKTLIGKGVEVYTFAHSGSNLIHYKHLITSAALDFKPDLIIVTVVENDFRESIYGNNRKDNWSVNFTNGSPIEEPPRMVNNLWLKRLLSKSALVRYLVINIDLINTSSILNKLFYAETRQFTEQSVQWNQEVTNKLTDYVAGEFAQLAKVNNFQLLFVLDTNRKEIYENKNFEEAEHHKLNSTLKESLKKFNNPSIDLHEVFNTAWEKDKKRFDWEFDDHWNEYAHQIIANKVAEWFEFNQGTLSE